MAIILVFFLLFSCCTLNAEGPTLKIKEYSLVPCSAEEIANTEQIAKKSDLEKLNHLPDDIRKLLKSTLLLQDRKFSIYSERITAVTVSQDKKLIAAGNEDGLISLWKDSENKTFTAKTYRDKFYVEHISISSDNKYLAYAVSPVDILTVLETETMLPVKTIQLKNNLLRVFFDNNDNLLIICAQPEDIQLQIWNVNDNLPIILPSNMDYVYDATISNDGKYLALGGSQGVLVWDLVSRKQYVSMDKFNGLLHFVRFSSDGKYIVTVNKDFILKVVDLATQTVICTKFVDVIIDMTVSGNEDIIYVTKNMDIKALSINGGTIKDVASSEVGIYEICKINNTEYALGCDNGAVRIINLQSKTFQELGLSYSQTGTLRSSYIENCKSENIYYIYDNNYFRSALLYDKGSSVLTEQKSFFEKGGIIDYSSRSGLYAIMNNDKLSVYNQKNTDHKEILFEFQDSGIQKTFFLFDDKFIGIKINDNTLQVRNVNGGEKLIELKTDTPIRIAISLNELIIIGCDQGEIEIFNTNTPSILNKIRVHDSGITCITISKKQNLIITADDQGILKIWKFINGGIKEYRTIKAHSKKINDVEIDELSDIVLTGSDDGTIKLWNLFSYELVYEFKEHNAIKDVCFAENTFLCYIMDNKPVIKTQLVTLRYDIEIENWGLVEYVDFYNSIIVLKNRTTNKYMYYKLTK